MELHGKNGINVAELFWGSIGCRRSEGLVGGMLVRLEVGWNIGRIIDYRRPPPISESGERVDSLGTPNPQTRESLW